MNETGYLYSSMRTCGLHKCYTIKILDVYYLSRHRFIGTEKIYLYFLYIYNAYFNNVYINNVLTKLRCTLAVPMR